MANGVINMDAIQAPKKGGISSCCATFLPKVLMKWKVMKIKTANTIGKPKPPYRIITPRVAPMKNINKQE